MRGLFIETTSPCLKRRKEKEREREREKRKKTQTSFKPHPSSFHHIQSLKRLALVIFHLDPQLRNVTLNKRCHALKIEGARGHGEPDTIRKETKEGKTQEGGIGVLDIKIVAEMVLDSEGDLLPDRFMGERIEFSQSEGVGAWKEGKMRKRKRKGKRERKKKRRDKEKKKTKKREKGYGEKLRSQLSSKNHSGGNSS